MKKFKNLLSFAFCVVVILFLSLGLIMSNTVYINWNGFGIDSEERVYIGNNSKIDVYQNGGYIGSISLPPYRTYSFTIQGNDTILLSNSLDVYNYDLSGAELSSRPDDQCTLYNQFKQKSSHVSIKGVRYMRKNFLLRYSVIKEDGTIVYQMPLFDYVVKLALIASSVSMSLVALLIIINRKKYRRE